MHLQGWSGPCWLCTTGQSLVEDLSGPICPAKPPLHRPNYMAGFCLNLECPSLFILGLLIGLTVSSECIFTRPRNPVNTYLDSSEKSKTKSQVSVVSL